jgi:hypothetical protein
MISPANGIAGEVAQRCAERTGCNHDKQFSFLPAAAGCLHFSLRPFSCPNEKKGLLSCQF